MAEELRVRQMPQGRPTSLSTKQLEEITTCPICRETFKDPRSLPCLHTFCLTCLDVCYNANIPEEIPKCPLCGQYYLSPDDGLCELPKNIYLNQLMEMTTITAFESQDMTELKVLPSIESSNYCCDVVTRKLPVFTTAIAKNFVRKLFTYIRLNNLVNTKTLMQNINVTDREAVMRELSDEGSSPLFEAVRLGRLPFVEYFLDECNADIEQRGPWQQQKDMLTVQVTPLWLAAVENRLAVVKCLVNHGAQVNAHTIWRSNVVRCACFSDHGDSRIDLVRYLVENGADISIPNAAGSGCIHLASASAELSRYLIEQGADVNATDIEGCTALHYAVENGCLDVVKELISLGADPHLQNENGVDVLQLALMNCRDEITAFLLSQTVTSDVNRADIFVLKGVCCAYRKQYKDAVTNWRQALLQSTRKNAFYRNKLLLYRRSDQSTSNRSQSWNKMEQLLTATEDISDFIQQQVVLCEELLGKCHPTTIFSLRYLAVVYADNNIDRWSVDASINALSRCRSMSVAERPNRSFVDVLQTFCITSVEFHSKRATVKFSDVARAFKLFVDEFVFTLKQPVFQICLENFLLPMKQSILLIYLMLAVADEPAEKIQLRELVKSLVELEPRAVDGRGLLHVAIEPSINSINSVYYSDSPNDLVIETLLECGSAVNCTDNEGSTPIDYVKKSTPRSLDQTGHIVNLFRHYESMVPDINQ